MKILTPGISDSEFIRGKVPMTKEEVRSISLCKLKLRKNDILLDIGAGTGSISIEAAVLMTEGKVYAIEKNPVAIDLIKKNSEKFKVENIDIIEGYAPEDIPNINFNRVFIGGSGGNIKEIIDYIDNKMEEGFVVINGITLENTYKGYNHLKKLGFESVEVIQIGINRGSIISDLTLMKAENPIFIVSGRKGKK